MQFRMGLKRMRRVALGIAILCSVFESARGADVYYAFDSVIGSAISGNVIVGYADATDRSLMQNGTSPSVSLVDGGSVQFNVDVYNASTFEIAGGTIGYGVDAHDSSIVRVTGGTSGEFEAHDSSIFDISGGIQNGDYRVSDHGWINFNGTGLSTSLVDPNYLGYTFYQLHGTLQSGQSVENAYLYVQNNSTAQFTFNTAVPEPGTVVLLLLGGCALLSRRGLPYFSRSK